MMTLDQWLEEVDGVERREQDIKRIMEQLECSREEAEYEMDSQPAQYSEREEPSRAHRARKEVR